MEEYFGKSIRTKMTAAMVVCAVITALLISIMMILSHYCSFEKEISEKMALISQNYANKFDSDLRSVEQSVKVMKYCLDNGFEPKQFNEHPNAYIEQYEREMDMLIKTVADDINAQKGIDIKSGVEAVYFTINPKLTGRVHEIWYADLAGNGLLQQMDSDPDPEHPYIESFYPENENMRWYYSPVMERKGVWSKPYEEPEIDETIISYTEPVFKEGILVGVVGIDISIDLMRRSIEELKVFDNGYAFLMDQDLHFLVHPEFSHEDSIMSVYSGNTTDQVQEALSVPSGTARYVLMGENKILGYSHMSNGWILGCTAPMSEAYMQLKIHMMFILLATILSVLIIVKIAFRISKSLSEPIIKITNIIENTAGFDFKTNNTLKVFANRSDEVGVMARETSKMKKILKGTGIGKAASMQKKSLQRVFPLPGKADMEVVYAAAHAVSGDGYYLKAVDEGLVLGVIWDVSGKGVTAALKNLAFNVMYHESTAKCISPIDVVRDLNERLCRLDEETYIAACCFSLDFEKGVANVAGAGISQFMHKSAKNKYEEKTVKGPFLGMFENSEFDQQSIHFKSGDRFYFFTDGMEFIEDDKCMEEMLNSLSIAELKSYITDSIRNCSNGSEGLKDDCTFIAFDIK
ncbi:Cache domain-containing protein [Peptoclostridium litorale DSM 5388]|uniref:Histidine kinase n=1 Tax=Peptoclostridium litorale DSM 5388 TaxID=1121324 RepID=A0A069RIG4_PEPLI|nr:SpoIIE family protein phosphatase [Peptoclostridium litorale]KDR96573.1 histidine kinase [Peptoclostridium litorale DSM 5388]SIN68961.1 Cache domain-containing protein [Peptoclostridium litorale DSM 5388]